jgi:putative peptidoglycan lipid II flippase
MSSRLARSAGLISLATLASRILGVARESVLASYFGASTSIQMDAYNVAFRVPNLLRDLFAEGAMTSAFVPTFTRSLTGRGREQAWRLGNLVINGLLVITGVLVAIGILLAEPITRLIAPDFGAIPGKLELTADLTRIMLPFLTAVAIAVAMMGMLNSLQRFFIPSLSPAMFNLVNIVCVIVLVPVMSRFGLPPVMAVAIGTLLGGLGQIVVQWPVLRKEGFRYRPVLDFTDPELRHILRMMVPGTVGLAAVNVNVLVNTILASSQEPGAVTWLTYAFRLMYLPIGLFGVSIATAALPDVSRYAAADDHASMRRTVSSALRLMLMLNVPAMVGLMVLAEPITALLYQRGAFNTYDTKSTASALMFYAPGLLGYSAVKIASPTFYSLRDSRTPVTVSVTSVAANLALNLWLVHVLGFRGLALGTALSALFNAAVLLWLLRGRLEGLGGRTLSVAFAKILAASLLMGFAAAATARWMTYSLGGVSEWAKLLRVCVSIAVGVLTLVVSARILRIEEFNEAVARVTRRLMPIRAGTR